MLSVLMTCMNHDSWEESVHTKYKVALLCLQSGLQGFIRFMETEL